MLFIILCPFRCPSSFPARNVRLEAKYPAPEDRDDADRFQAPYRYRHDIPVALVEILCQPTAVIVVNAGGRTKSLRGPFGQAFTGLQRAVIEADKLRLTSPLAKRHQRFLYENFAISKLYAAGKSCDYFLLGFCNNSPCVDLMCARTAYYHISHLHTGIRREAAVDRDNYAGDKAGRLV